MNVDWIELGDHFDQSDEVWLNDLVEMGWTIARTDDGVLKICKANAPGWMHRIEEGPLQ